MEIFLITLAKYIFIFLGFVFMYQNIKFIFGERHEVSYDIFELSNRQFFVNIIFVVFAGFIAVIASEQSDKAFLFYCELLAVLLVSKVLLKKVYKYSCPIMFNNVLFLVSIGLITLNRIGFSIGHAQLVYFAISVMCMLLVYFGLKVFKNIMAFRYVFLVVSFVLILAPFFLGVATNGSLNWIKIGGLSFQPSELVKITYAFFLATYFARKNNMLRTIVSIGLTVLLVSILVLQKDFGASLMFFTMFMMIMYVATGSKQLFVLGYMALAVASYVSYQFMGHIQTRVAIWQNPYADPLGKGYQVLQSIFAMTSYAPLGIGIYNGNPKAIPVVESDIIFALICEEFGIIFGLLIMAIYIIIFYRGIHIALRVQKKEYSYIALGLTLSLLFQTFLIIGGITKFIPLTGVTLPFISYGGTSLVVSCIIIGVLQFIHQRSLVEDIEDDEEYLDEEYLAYE